MNTTRRVQVYDFWHDYFLGEFDGELTTQVSSGGARTLCLTEATGEPQVLAVSNYLPQAGYGLDTATCV